MLRALGNTLKLPSCVAHQHHGLTSFSTSRVLQQQADAHGSSPKLPKLVQHLALIFGAGSLYLYTTHYVHNNKNKSSEEGEQTASPLDEQNSTASLLPGPTDISHEAATPESAKVGDEEKSENGAVEEEEETALKEEAVPPKQEEDSTIVDSNRVLKPIQDILSKTAEEIIEETESSLSMYREETRTPSIGSRITAATLLTEAIRRGQGPPKDAWKEYAIRHKQAQADAETIESLLKETELKARHEYEEKAEQLEIDHATNLQKERKEFGNVLADLELKLDALSQALGKGADAIEESRKRASLAIGATALRSALNNDGIVNATHLGKLIQSDDPLVRSVVSHLERHQDVLSEQELVKEYASVERAVRDLVVLPRGQGGGLFALAVAKLAATLRVKEDGFNFDDGIEAKLGSVRADIQAGRLHEAACKLESAVDNTSASSVVSHWVRRARQREAMKQHVTLLEIHAAAADV